jgi:YYY domain-containing protein
MMSDPRLVQVRRFRLWLAALLVFAAAVRLVGLDWDQRHNFHPDERRIAYAIEELSFRPLQLNPHFFAYGSFPLYVTRAVVSLRGLVNPAWTQYSSIILTGRAVSGVVGALTVLLLVLLGSRLYDRQVGLLAGFLLAACVLHVQNSHYVTTDVFLTFLVLLALFFLTRLAQRGWTRDYIYAGIAIGFATATKFSALPLLAPLGVAALVRLYEERRLLPIVARGALALLALCLAFACGQPYALLDFKAFSHDILEQSAMVRNAGLLPYTHQYVGTPKYLYDLGQLILWGMAPPLGLAALWASAARLVGVVRERSATDLVLLFWVVPFFLVTGWFEVKFVRYLLPIYPILILWAAAWLVRIARRSRLGSLALWGVVAGTLLSTLAFLSIYQRDHTVVTASEWVYRHIPAGSTILSQHWDEGFPFSLPGYNANRYKVIDLPYYEPDNSAKMRQIAEQLAKADYIALQTKRLYGAVTRAPKKYPLTNNYFYLLFAGDLGYTLIYDHASRPSLFGVEFPDELADESITVYDHPKVLIFQNTGRLGAGEIFDKINRGLPSRKLTRTDLLLASAEGREGLGSTGAAPMIRSSAAGLLWFAALVEVLGLAAYAILHRWLPVPGCYALAKVVGLLGFAYLSWLLASLGQVGFTRALLQGVVAFLVVLGVVAWRGSARRPERPEWVPTEAVFWGVFAFFLLVRAFNPEIFWGEKPMDFAFLNALNRATSLPPPEPWFAGSMLHYTYFGHYVVAALGKATHVHTGLTFNLGIALFGALTATAAFALGVALGDRWRYGWLAAVFTVLIGNLAALRELIGRGNLGFDHFWATSRVIKDTINEYPFWSFLFADLHAHVLVMPFSITFLALAVWWVRRGDGLRPIRPAPLFALLALTLGAIMVTNGWSSPTYVLFFPFLLACVQVARHPPGRARVLAAILLGLVLTAALALQALYPSPPGLEPETAKRVYTVVELAALGLAALVLVPGAVVPGAAVVGLAYVLFAPFWRHFSPPPRNWGFENQSFAHFWDFANIFGLFLYIAIPFLLAVWRRQLMPAGRERMGLARALPMGMVAVAVGLCWILSVPLIEKPLSAIGVHGSLRAGLAILAFLALHLALTASLTLAERITCTMLSFAFAITAGTDIVFVWDRMNTIFKFYLEAWFLFAAATAYAALVLWQGGLRSPWMRHAWQAGLVALLVLSVFTAGTGVYGILAVERAPGPRPTLDGTAYLRERDPHDRAAYEWLNENVGGIPVIAEAYGPSYQEFARVSMNTGLPAVLGWDYHVHQRAQRWPDINRRKDDLKTLYTSDQKATVEAILRKYHVALVYVGGLERRTHSGGNLKNFNEWSNLLTPVYQNEGASVFAVNGQFTGAMPITTIEEVPQVKEEEEVFRPGAPGQLSQPRGLAVDRKGGIYVADFGNNRLQKFGPDLKFLSGWGTLGNLPAQFKQPGDVDVGEDGNVYVADTWNQRVQVFTPEGEVLREWGGSFFGPRGIAVGGGRVYLADTGNHKIRVFDLEGQEQGTWGERGSERGQLIEPVGIAVGPKGRVYVCDNGNARVQIFEASGAPAGSFAVDGWETKVFSEPHITISPKGTLWVTVPRQHLIRAYDAKGKVLHEIRGTEDRSGVFTTPMGIGLLPATGELVVADLENRIVKLPVPKNVP